MASSCFRLVQYIYYEIVHKVHNKKKIKKRSILSILNSHLGCQWRFLVQVYYQIVNEADIAIAIKLL